MRRIRTARRLYQLRISAIMNNLNRKQFLKGGLAVGTGLALTPLSSLTAARATKTTQLEADDFFTLGKRNDHWWLITPEGKPFFRMGLNHIDPASLRYPENIEIWREKYSGSTVRWIEESVTPNLKLLGFNTVGWVHEVTVKKWQHSRHAA